MSRMIRLEGENGVKKSTVINFLLDETGSMLPRKNDVIKGFNDYIHSLRQEKEEGRGILFTLTKFNSSIDIQISYLAKSIEEVPDLTDNSYTPNSGTPLFDAIGETIRQLDKFLKEEKGKPGVLFVIMTDGEENASTKFNKDKITKIIRDRENDGWTFVYLGADQNAWSQAGSIGFQAGNVMAFSSGDYNQTFDRLSAVTRTYYRDGSNYTSSFFTPVTNIDTKTKRKSGKVLK